MNQINMHNPIIDEIRKQTRMIEKLQHALYVSISMLCTLEKSLTDKEKENLS